MGRRMNSKEVIEAYLIAERDDRLKNKILASEVQVINHLLDNSLGMTSAYDEILSKTPPGFFFVGSVKEAWQLVVDTIVSTAAFDSPIKSSAKRAALRRVEELSDEIARKALELASIIRKKSQYCDKYGIQGPSDYHPLDVLELAAASDEQRYRFRRYVAPKLARVRAEFDLKYWPHTADFVEAVATAQRGHEFCFSDNITSAALQSRQGNSPRDFIRALDEALAELSREHDIPDTLSHRTIAEITNCALALPAEDALSRESVKAMRAYERKKRG